MSPRQRKLKVVALISGGKDSVFSILHCLANGHDVAALANLHPPTHKSDKLPTAEGNDDTIEIEDMESHMYQTIGHQVIPLYEEALGIPLYRLPIVGSAVQRDRSYDYTESTVKSTQDQTDQDETESLTSLLRTVKAAHPEINAVSSGAILSTYQRTRVESVAMRLGLESLSLLWQYPYLPPAGHSSLLLDMANVGADARIVKVASAGLDKKHLWLNVADSSNIKRLERDMGQHSELEVGSVLGEGGEYETLALDGPSPLWKKRMQIEIGDECLVADEAGAAHVRVGPVTLHDKGPSLPVEPRKPELLDSEWQTVLEDCQKPSLYDFTQTTQTKEAELDEECIGLPDPQQHMFETSEHVYLLNMNAEPNQPVDRQFYRLCSRISPLLSTYTLSTDAIDLVTILLRSMQDFALVNVMYREMLMFSKPNPPARVTISCGNLLPRGISVVLSIIAWKGSRNHRDGLHVQSQSYWAPANIGPYSQAVSTPLAAVRKSEQQSRLVWMSGQIPLVPASMQMVDGPFKMHAVLALQHLWRVGRAMQVHWWINGIAFITASTKDEAEERAATAIGVWQKAVQKPSTIHNDSEEDENFDIGNARLRQPWMQPPRRKTEPLLSPIPDWTRASKVDGKETAPPSCFVVHVTQLPREALVEWTALGLDLVDENIKASSVRQGVRHETKDTCSKAWWTIHSAYDQEDVENVSLEMEDRAQTGQIELVEAYVRVPPRTPVTDWLSKHHAQVTPCHHLWNELGALSLLVRCRWSPSAHEHDP